MFCPTFFDFFVFQYVFKFGYDLPGLFLVFGGGDVIARLGFDGKGEPYQFRLVGIDAGGFSIETDDFLLGQQGHQFFAVGRLVDQFVFMFDRSQCFFRHRMRFQLRSNILRGRRCGSIGIAEQISLGRSSRFCLCAVSQNGTGQGTEFQLFKQLGHLFPVDGIYFISLGVKLNRCIDIDRRQRFGQAALLCKFFNAFFLLAFELVGIGQDAFQAIELLEQLDCRLGPYPGNPRDVIDRISL